MGRYLLTGAAGFIASRVAAMLLDDGHSVHGLDNMNDAYDVRMKQYRLTQLENHPKFRFQRMDVADRDQVRTLEDGGEPFDAVINLAARAGVRYSVENPWEYFRTNVDGTLNLLEYTREHDIPKFVLASSSSVYGSDAPMPTPETANTDNPVQPYAASKKAAEVLCYAYHALHGLDVTVFRYFTVYGPAGRPDMVMFRFIQWMCEGQTVYVNGDGKQSRGFTYVDDIARGTIMGLQSVGYEIINLGGHEQVSLMELIRGIEERIESRAAIKFREAHPADIQQSWADVEKAKRILSWEPKVSFDEGLDSALAWYQSERAWACEVDTSD